MPLQSLNNAAFGSLFSGVTLTADAAIDMRGVADVVARTKIGDIPLSGIPFAVISHLKGMHLSFHDFISIKMITAGTNSLGGERQH